MTQTLKAAIGIFEQHLVASKGHIGGETLKRAVDKVIWPDIAARS